MNVLASIDSTSPCSTVMRWFAVALTIASIFICGDTFAKDEAAAADVVSDDMGLLPTEGLPVASWDEATRLIGRRSVIYGKIVDVGHTSGISFLNFEKRGKRADDDESEKDSTQKKKKQADFTVVIFGASDSKFDKSYEELFLDKNVTVVGTVTLFRGSPQIVVADPAQIQVVEKLPKTKIVKPVKVEVGEELVVGSYNIKNLFDMENDPYHSDEGTAPKPRREMRQVADVIREINADVLALQEVESRGYLKQFMETMLYDMGYEHIVHFEGNDTRGIDVCLISRVPVGQVTSHRHHVFEAHDGGDQKFGRDLLRVELLPEGGKPFEMWVVHLKSNSGGKELNEPIRLGECREVHRLIAKRIKEDPNVSLVLCGDFNDEFETKTLQTILGEPAQLRTIFDKVPESERITYNKKPYRSMIDFMLCTPAMVDRMVPDSFQIRAGTDEDSGSDHNPIFARFKKGKSSAKEVAGAGGNDAAPVSVQSESISSEATSPTTTSTPAVTDAVQTLEPSDSADVETRPNWLLVAVGGLGVLALSVIAFLAMSKSRA